MDMAETSKLLARGRGAHEHIRKELVAGRWVPGEKLMPAVLAELYETSTTVIREALTRLAGEKLIVVKPNLGFFVPLLSTHELSDLTEVRCRTEAHAVELAVQRGDITWESELIAAHHQLSRTPRRGPNDPEHVAEAWSDVHRAFHSKLIEACGVPVLIDFSSYLSDSTDLYRRWAAPSRAAAVRNVEKEHAAILAAALDRDAARVAALLRKHYETTARVILESGLVREASGV
jgi:DNA-binding GntR family transcriptional regulator